MFKLFTPNIHFVIVAVIIALLKLTFPSIPAIYIFISWVIGYGAGMISMYRTMIRSGASQWIPVEQDLPENKQIGDTKAFVTPAVIIKYEIDNEGAKQLEIGVGAYSHFHKKWFLKNEAVDGDVIEWMYLPTNSK